MKKQDSDFVSRSEMMRAIADIILKDDIVVYDAVIVMAAASRGLVDLIHETFGSGPADFARNKIIHILIDDCDISNKSIN